MDSESLLRCQSRRDALGRKLQREIIWSMTRYAEKPPASAFDRLCEITRLYSSEIEYSDENTDIPSALFSDIEA